VIVAVASALLAGLFAYRTKRSELRAQAQLETERRIASSRGETFWPLIERIGDFWDKLGKGEDVASQEEWVERELQPTFLKFLRWVQIYGSDEAVWAAHRLMQAIYHDAPANVVSRLLSDIVLAARRDLAHPDTKATSQDIMGLRVSDLYEHKWASLTLERLYEEERWTPPWGTRFKYGKPVS
jgi:hypothetical protein